MRRALALAVAFALPALAQQQHQHGSDAGSKVPAHQNHPMDPGSPEPRGQSMSLKVAGKTAKAYFARPEGQFKGAILGLHEW